MKLTLEFNSNDELESLCDNLQYLLSYNDEWLEQRTLTKIFSKFQDAITKEKLK